MRKPVTTPELDTQLTKLNHNLSKQLSFKRNLLMSIVSGVGYALGASLIAGLVIAILSWSIDSIQDVPVLNKIFSSQELQQTLNNIEHGD